MANTSSLAEVAFDTCDGDPLAALTAAVYVIAKYRPYDVAKMGGGLNESLGARRVVREFDWAKGGTGLRANA